MRKLALALFATLCCLACGAALPNGPAARSARGAVGSDQTVECEFMTVLINYSRLGMGLSPDDVEVASRVAEAMAEEFKSYGTRVTSSREEAYWSVMILAANNERYDGYIFSALLAARNMNEGYDPGVSVFSTEEDPAAEDDAQLPGPPALYNGLSYGPYENLEDQAREYVRRAYAAVFPTARRMCEFAEADRRREERLDAQLPAPPVPL